MKSVKGGSVQKTYGTRRRANGRTRNAKKVQNQKKIETESEDTESEAEYNTAAAPKKKTSGTGLKPKNLKNSKNNTKSTKTATKTTEKVKSVPPVPSTKGKMTYGQSRSRKRNIERESDYSESDESDSDLDVAPKKKAGTGLKSKDLKKKQDSKETKRTSKIVAELRKSISGNSNKVAIGKSNTENKRNVNTVKKGSGTKRSRSDSLSDDDSEDDNVSLTQESKEPPTKKAKTVTFS